jgi:hypothetical protein
LAGATAASGLPDGEGTTGGLTVVVGAGGGAVGVAVSAGTGVVFGTGVGVGVASASASCVGPGSRVADDSGVPATVAQAMSTLATRARKA